MKKSLIGLLFAVTAAYGQVNTAGTVITTPSTVALIGGQSDEAFTSLTGPSAVAPDTTNYQPGRSSVSGLQGGWNVAIPGPTTGATDGITFYTTFSSGTSYGSGAEVIAAGILYISTQSGNIGNTPASSPAYWQVMVPLPPFSALGCWVYVPAASLPNFSKIICAAQMTSGDQVLATISSSSTPALASGWNLVRVATGVQGPIRANESVQFAYVEAVTTGSANFTVGQLWLETPPKATIVITADGPAANIFTNVNPASSTYCSGGPCTGTSAGGINYVGGLADLQGSNSVLNVPVVLDISSNGLGGGSGTNQLASWPQINTIMASNRNNELNPEASTGDPAQSVGSVTTSGTAVTWSGGSQFVTDGSWSGNAITINGVGYTISSVSNATALTLTGSAGTQSSVAYTESMTPAQLVAEIYPSIKSIEQHGYTISGYKSIWILGLANCSNLSP